MNDDVTAREPGMKNEEIIERLATVIASGFMNDDPSSQIAREVVLKLAECAMSEEMLEVVGPHVAGTFLSRSKCSDALRAALRSLGGE